MEPTIEQQGSGYKVTWPSKRVEMDVRNIKPKGFKAQVAVFLNGDPVHRSNPVLDSTSGMNSFTSKLNKRRPEADYGVDWEQVVEDLSGIVIDTYYEGQPAVKLSEVDLENSFLWRIENVVLDNQITMIWADGGTGKSMFAAFLSVLAQQGHMTSEHGLLVEPSNVLYLDYETDKVEIAKRTHMIQAGLGIEDVAATHTSSQITYNKCYHPLVQEENHIVDLIWKNNIDMVVIDSMGRALGGELESPDSVLPFFEAVERLKTTVLLVSHANKSGELFGSAYTKHSARLIWEAKRSSSTTTSMDFSLFCRKANNVPMQPPQSWGVDFSNDKAVYTRKDVFETEDAGELSYYALVFNILKDEGQKTREYLRDRIKELKPEDNRGRKIPEDRTERNVDSAVSKQKADNNIRELDGGLLELASKDGESWQSI